MSQIGECPPVEDSFSSHDRRWPTSWRMAALLSLCLVGCGRIVSQKATDQLIAGDAVDRSVAQIDFRILTGKKIFLDSQYVNKTVPGVGFVTSDYIVSSIRQKMMCDGCLLQEKMDEADFIVEMRIGALGADGHEIIFGMPPNNYMSLAATVTPTSSPAAAILPSMPELSVAKKDDQMAAAKIALFAYNRRTREPIWQSGISESRSVVADRWFFGAGPFHKGSIYGSKKQDDASLFSSEEADSAKPDYFVERRFNDPTKSLADTPPAAKPAVPTPPAAGPPVAVAAQPANAATAAPTVPAVTATPAPTAAAAPAGNVAPVAAAAPAATAPAATPPAVTAPATASTPPASTSPMVGATQTVNAAPATVATPPSNATPAPSPAPSAASASPPAAASSANVPTNAPKTVPSVNVSPSGQPVNVPTTPPNGPANGSAADMLSVSVH
jgi:hypothetical protein